MVDLKLKRLVARNWAKFRNIDLTIPDSGLVLVQGINSASCGALDSVGAGKTMFGEAICRTLLGTTGRFATSKQFSYDKLGDSYVRIEAELLGEPLIVEAGYKCAELSPTGDALRYSYKTDQKIERGRIEQTRADLSKLIGVSPELAEWTVFIDGQKLHFNKLSQAACVDLVMSALRQPPWTQFFDNSKAKLGKFKRDVAHNQTDHQKALDEVAEAKRRVERSRDRLDEEKGAFERRKKAQVQKKDDLKRRIDAKKQAVVEAKERMKEIAKKLKKMEEERSDETHRLEIELHNIEDQLADKEEDKKPLVEARDNAWEAFTVVKTNWENYAKAAENCPTCRRPMGEIDKDHLEKLNKIRLKASDVYKKAAATFTTFGQTIVDLNEKHRALSKDFREVSAKNVVMEHSDQYGELEEKIQARSDEIHAIELELAEMKDGPSNEEVVEAQTNWKADCDYLVLAEAKLVKTGSVLAEDKATLKVMEYWNMAYSPYGIPNMVLREAIAPLNHEAKRISATMTGGTIEVRFSTTREMASGMEKAQLNIEVDNKLGDKDLAGSSKGEAGLSNFIISEALSEVGQVSRRIGFRWFDEIVPHQDPKVCASFYSYMRDVAKRLGIVIFLVDHNPTAANYVDHFLIVEKSGTPPEVVGSVRWK